MKARTLKGIAARLAVVFGLGLLLMLIGEELTFNQWACVNLALVGAEMVGHWFDEDGGAS